MRTTNPFIFISKRICDLPLYGYPVKIVLWISLVLLAYAYMSGLQGRYEVAEDVVYTALALYVVLWAFGYALIVNAKHRTVMYCTILTGFLAGIGAITSVIMDPFEPSKFTLRLATTSGVTPISHVFIALLIPTFIIDAFITFLSPLMQYSREHELKTDDDNRRFDHHHPFRSSLDSIQPGDPEYDHYYNVTERVENENRD